MKFYFLVGLGFVACASGSRDLPRPPDFSSETFLESERANAVEPPLVEDAQHEEASAKAPLDPLVEPEPDELPGRVLGSVAGSPVTAEDLLLEWNDISSRELWLVAERFVISRLALAEAQRLEIRLDPVDVERRVESEQRELRAEIVRRGLDLEPEDFIRRELGLEPERYLARLRRATIQQLLAERAVRAGSLSTKSVKARLIVVPEQETMDEVTRALEAGADFAELAERHSIDDSSKEGGLVPFVVWQEYAPLARLAFRTKAGEVGGPLETADHLFLVKVEEFREPIEGHWSQLREAVERTLEEFPVSDGEFLSWKLGIEERYPVELEGLVELLGTAR